MYKIILKIVSFFVISVITIWLFTNNSDPQPSTSIGLLFSMPILFVFNLIIGAVLFFFNRKLLAILFCINSLVVPVLQFQFFNFIVKSNIEKHEQTFRFRSYESENKLFIELKNGDKFSILKYTSGYKSILKQDIGLFEQKSNFLTKEKFWILKTQDYEMKLYNDKLIGYENKGDTIKLTEDLR